MIDYLIEYDIKHDICDYGSLEDIFKHIGIDLTGGAYDRAADLLEDTCPCRVALWIKDNAPILAGNGERVTLNNEGYFVDDLGRYGYTTRLAGNYVCYTDGHMCDCRE
jgi:hypothetical protein